jgi:hypothetical protein
MWSGRQWVARRDVAVRGRDGLVVAHAAGQAVPEHFEPAVPQLADRGMVAVVVGDVPVVELPGPRGSGSGLTNLNYRPIWRAFDCRGTPVARVEAYAAP